MFSASVQIPRTGRKVSGFVSDFRAAAKLTIDRVIRATALQHLVVNTRYNTVHGRDSGLGNPNLYRSPSPDSRFFCGTPDHHRPGFRLAVHAADRAAPARAVRVLRGVAAGC